MGYYLRAFCASEEVPTLRRVLEWTASEGYAFEVASRVGSLDGEWREAVLTLGTGRPAIMIDVSARHDELLSEEVEEFVEFVEDVDDSAGREKVLAHLQSTRAVVGTQLLDAGDEGSLNAANALLGYFVEHCGAMIQADGEGFYDGDRLLVELD